MADIGAQLDLYNDQLGDINTRIRDAIDNLPNAKDQTKVVPKHSVFCI